MVRLVLVLFFLFAGERVGRGVPSFDTPKLYSSKQYHFNQIYQQIRSHEGNYVNHPSDKGRETYGGISRRFNPNWLGWNYIDEAKPLNRHDSVGRVEWMVKDWYLDRWIQGGFEKIESQELALNLFDFSIHSSPRTVELKVNRVLAKYGCEPVKVQGEWIPEIINTLPPTEFILHLKIERLKLFNYLVTKDPSQMVFYSGWISRIENI